MGSGLLLSIPKVTICFFDRKRNYQLVNSLFIEFLLFFVYKGLVTFYVRIFRTYRNYTIIILI